MTTGKRRPFKLPPPAALAPLASRSIEPGPASAGPAQELRLELFNPSDAPIPFSASLGAHVVASGVLPARETARFSASVAAPPGPPLPFYILEKSGNQLLVQALTCGGLSLLVQPVHAAFFAPPRPEPNIYTPEDHWLVKLFNELAMVYSGLIRAQQAHPYATRTHAWCEYDERGRCYDRSGNRLFSGDLPPADYPNLGRPKT